MPSLPLDLVLEIAARSDPATLVRCAAACRDARRRVAADSGFRLRLRRHANCFVPSLLRGHLVLVHGYNGHFLPVVELLMVDLNAADMTARPVSAGEGFPPVSPDGGAAGSHKLVASREGLVLVRSTDLPQPPREELRVCDPGTGRSLTLPPEPAFPGAALKNWEPYTLIVGAGGDGGNGIRRPFQVLKANLVMMSDHHCYLQIQTFSSANGSWGGYSEIRTPHVHGISSLLQRVTRPPLVAGGSVHWLCITKSGGYVLKLHITTAQVTMTALPASFPCSDDRGIDYLLVTATAGGGELMVLVPGNEKISAWVQTKRTAKWQPWVVVDVDAIRQFKIRDWFGPFRVHLHWFAERSGLVLFSSNGYGFFLLDVRSMKIVRRVQGAGGILYRNGCFPYEMDLASWVPTFTRTI